MFRFSKLLILVLCNFVSSLNPRRCIFLRFAATNGQSYKTFTLITNDSRVVKWGIFKSGTTLEL